MRVLFDLNRERGAWWRRRDGHRKRSNPKHRRHFGGKARERRRGRELKFLSKSERRWGGGQELICCSGIGIYQLLVECKDANTTSTYQDDTISSVSSFLQILSRGSSLQLVALVALSSSLSIDTIYMHALNASSALSQISLQPCDMSQLS